MRRKFIIYVKLKREKVERRKSEVKLNWNGSNFASTFECVLEYGCVVAAEHNLGRYRSRFPTRCPARQLQRLDLAATTRSWHHHSQAFNRKVSTMFCCSIKAFQNTQNITWKTTPPAKQLLPSYPIDFLKEWKEPLLHQDRPLTTAVIRVCDSNCIGQLMVLSPNCNFTSVESNHANIDRLSHFWSSDDFIH